MNHGSNRLHRKLMASAAIQRVLDRSHDRMAISSLADLQRAYNAELAVHGAAIAAHADRVLALKRTALQHRSCQECGGPIEGAVRLTRWFCSNRCRQRAYRKRQHAT
jgi:hypothetical protein